MTESNPPADVGKAFRRLTKFLLVMQRAQDVGFIEALSSAHGSKPDKPYPAARALFMADLERVLLLKGEVEEAKTALADHLILRREDEDPAAFAALVMRAGIENTFELRAEAAEARALSAEAENTRLRTAVEGARVALEDAGVAMLLLHDWIAEDTHQTTRIAWADWAISRLRESIQALGAAE